MFATPPPPSPPDSSSVVVATHDHPNIRPMPLPQAGNEHSRDLVSRFLQADPTKRLGNLAGGIDEARKHPYFADIDWNALAHKKMPVSERVCVAKCWG